MVGPRRGNDRPEQVRQALLRGAKVLSPVPRGVGSQERPGSVGSKEGGVICCRCCCCCCCGSTRSVPIARAGQVLFLFALGRGRSPHSFCAPWVFYVRRTAMVAATAYVAFERADNGGVRGAVLPARPGVVCTSKAE